MSANFKAYLMLTLCAFFWSGNFIVGKFATLYEVPPLTLNFFRWLIVWIILIPFTFKDIFLNIKIQAEQMSFTKKSMAELIAFHTGQKAEIITEDSDRDRWFTAAEAKEYGFVDHVVKSAGQVSGSGGTSR